MCFRRNLSENGLKIEIARFIYDESLI